MYFYYEDIYDKTCGDIKVLSHSASEFGVNPNSLLTTAGEQRAEGEMNLETGTVSASAQNPTQVTPLPVHSRYLILSEMLDQKMQENTPDVATPDVAYNCSRKRFRTGWRDLRAKASSSSLGFEGYNTAYPKFIQAP